jgi:hypothetical protein
MRKIFITILTFIFVFLIIENKTYFLQRLVFIKGIFDIPKEFKEKIKPNSILYITLKNDKGVIFAVKEIINPKPPLQFEINHKNVLYPDLITINAKVQAHINTHGNVGEIKVGDIYSEIKNTPIINIRLKIYAEKIKY